MCAVTGLKFLAICWKEKWKGFRSIAVLIFFSNFFGRKLFRPFLLRSPKPHVSPRQKPIGRCCVSEMCFILMNRRAMCNAMFSWKPTVENTQSRSPFASDERRTVRFFSCSLSIPCLLPRRPNTGERHTGYRRVFLGLVFFLLFSWCERRMQVDRNMLCLLLSLRAFVWTVWFTWRRARLLTMPTEWQNRQPIQMVLGKQRCNCAIAEEIAVERLEVRDGSADAIPGNFQLTKR